MKVLTVVGARPNFVKVAPLVKQMEKMGIDFDLVHTGQHYDRELSKDFFDQLEIPDPNIYLGVGSGTHGVQTGKTMMKMEEVLMADSYDIVLVVGDVNSTLAASIAAVKLQIPVGHIEAGYRSFDMQMPEEVNRVLVDRVSQLLFAPTENSVLNLLNEGIDKERTFLVGNIMVETLLKNIHRMERPEVLDDIGDYMVLTLHRAENTDDRNRLLSILKGAGNSDVPVIFPVHPRTKEKLRSHGINGELEKNKNIIYTKPLTYLEFQYLLAHSKCALTDSGGVQEEAMVHKVPCLTLRKNTERMITMQYGANKLVGTDTCLISTEIGRILRGEYKAWPIPPFWDKRVSKRILSCIVDHQELLFVPTSDLITQ
ncbi:MAG: UDP-N-acetylglucosamine 2-epimerase (non-hydrolyzing) [Candidatus Methanofastidiosa archaeon]|nr:UDP-N-acetylglucosamine 2-epimerase (non-hydrolyzing) [Candidatus Methanofastidiosa archaeon]